MIVSILAAVLTFILGADVLHAAPPITLGRGPLLGHNTAGVAYYEQFLDWTADDLRALDAEDVPAARDAGHGSRDLVAFYSRLAEDDLFLRADLFDLSAGGDAKVDLYMLIDCTPGGNQDLPNGLEGRAAVAWDLAVVTYDATRAEVVDAAGRVLDAAHLGSYWQSELDAIELGVRREVLVNAGWDTSSPITFHVLTVADGVGKPTDHLGDDGDVDSHSAAGRTQLAVVAHGNQSLQPGVNLRERLYAPPVLTGTPYPSGFRLTLDTHTLLGLPLNVHLSGPLVVALAWHRDPRPIWDGPSFLADVARLVDDDPSTPPGAAIGGVWAEHILPFMRGEANRRSMALYEDLSRELWGLSASDIAVAHVPERVIGSRADGHDSFADIAAAGYRAIYLDEVAHLRDWLHPEDPWSGTGSSFDAPHQHKIHVINGVHTFFINDAEDRQKFWQQDGGAHRAWRRNLLAKALHTDSAQLTLLFDDWEALAGWSFGTGYNDNAVNYDRVLRWVANHPWIEVVTLKEILARATDASHPLHDPRWIHGGHEPLGDREPLTYDYLQHATEDGYRAWYEGSSLEQSFRHAVPVIEGVLPGGRPLPSGKRFGDLATPGTLVHDTWQAVLDAPANRLRTLAELAFSAMLFETAWHDEDHNDFTRDPATGYRSWLVPDTTPDRLAGFALELHSHLRDVTVTTAAASWVEALASGHREPGVTVRAVDLDQDGVDEFVLANERLWLAFDERGGRAVQAYGYDPEHREGFSILAGSPLHHPSAQGEEEPESGGRRSPAFHDLLGVDEDPVYGAVLGAGSLEFTRPGGLVVKRFRLEEGSAVLQVEYVHRLGGELKVRLGVGVDQLDLLYGGRIFDSEVSGTRYVQTHPTRGRVVVTAGAGVSIRELPEAERFAIPLVERLELGIAPGGGVFRVELSGAAPPAPPE